MKNLEKIIKKYLKERGWNNLRPADLAKSIVIESAELLEHFQWEGLELEDVKNKSKDQKEEIASEIADVMIYCIELSVLLDLDTEKIIVDKLNKIKAKYPAKLMKKMQDSGSTDEYWNIKKNHRKSKNSK